MPAIKYNICDTYAISHQLSYNPIKSFSLCFRPKQIKINPPSFLLGKQHIPAVDKYKYLGIIVSEANCDDDLKGKCRSVKLTPICYYENLVTVLQI